MKPLLFLMLLISIPVLAHSQDRPKFDTALLESVGFLEVNQAFGTAFVVREKNQYFIVTAGHAFEGLKSGEKTKFNLTINGYEVKGTLPVFFSFSDTTADIAIIPIKFPTHVPHIEIDTVDPELGEQLYCLGFTITKIGDKEIMKSAYYKGSRKPILKLLYMSGVNEQYMKDRHYIIDGQTLEGFSGSPIFKYDYTSKKYKLTAVVSGNSLTNMKRLSQSGPILDDSLFSPTTISDAYPSMALIEIINQYSLRLK